MVLILIVAGFPIVAGYFAWRADRMAQEQGIADADADARVERQKKYREKY